MRVKVELSRAVERMVALREAAKRVREELEAKKEPPAGRGPEAGSSEAESS